MRIKLKNAACLLTAALLVMLMGCGARQNAETPCMSIAFENGRPVYTGTEQQFCQVEEGQTGQLTVSVQRERGKLNLSVSRTDDPGRYCYRGTELPSSDFTVTLAEPGEYRVWIEAEGFAGSYGLEWTIEDGAPAGGRDGT